MKNILVIAILFSFLSCKEENILKDDKLGNKINYLMTMQEDADIYLIADRMKINSLDGESYSYVFQNSSYFFDENGNYTAVDELKLNGNNISQIIDSSDVGFNHSNKHIWYVDDSNGIPNFSDTINQKINFNIIYPTSISDTLSKSSGFNLNINYVMDCDSLLVMINTHNLFSHYKVDSTINKFANDNSKYKIVPNASSINISASDLSGISPNRIISIDVVGLVYTKKEKSGFTVLTASVIRNKVYCLLGE